MNPVMISQVETRIKIGGAYAGATFKPVSLFWFTLYLFYVIPKSIREDIAQRTRERRERAFKSPAARKHDVRVMRMFMFDMFGCFFLA